MIRASKSQESKRMDALQTNSGGTGGVGENVGFHNERFNDYDNTTGNRITGGSSSNDYNHAEGKGNVINSCANTYIGGKGNTANGLYSSGFIHGEANTAQGSRNAAVFGNANTLSMSHHSFIAGGGNNEAGGATYCLIGGVSNDLLSTSNVNAPYATFVMGNGNDVRGNVAGCAIIGENHKVVDRSQLTVVGRDADTTQISMSNLIFFAAGGSTYGMIVNSNGAVYASGGYNAMGADYAEYFEWLDGNPENEDRCGMLVALDGDKITLAHGNDVFGIISGNPSVVGNAAAMNWQGKYQKDVFGRILYDDDGKPLLNPDFDPDMKYKMREQRPEWAAVGIVGRLIINDNGSCKPNGYVSARNGIGTASLSPTNIRVLRRVDDKHIEVFIK